MNGIEMALETKTRMKVKAVCFLAISVLILGKAVELRCDASFHGTIVPSTLLGVPNDYLFEIRSSILLNG